MKQSDNSLWKMNTTIFAFKIVLEDYLGIKGKV